MARVPASIRRLAYRAASRLLGVYRTVRRPTLHGVRCVLSRGDEVLLVRHTYGDERWSLPGGLNRRRETPAATARREMHEELGVDVTAWRDLGVLRYVGADRSRHVVTCLAAPCPDGDPVPNEGEIAEIGWFSVDDLPGDELKWTREIIRRAWRA